MVENRGQVSRPTIVETVAEKLLLACACLAIFTTVGIVFSVLFESLQFFRSVPAHEFIRIEWSPQTAIREDQVGSSGSGAVPLFVGTLLVSAVAMVVAVPIGLMSAIYLAEYANKEASIAKPALEVLAGIPTVVYGFFAALTVAPFIRNLGESYGLSVSSESAAAGGVMGVMIIPFISSLADDVITAVPGRCAMAPRLWVQPNLKPYVGLLSPPPCRVLSAVLCWRSLALARP